ncbi:MAG: hypothetical protein J0L88_06935 [Xanthomonadales bacterium]|nr:hypothetical protein [Xanthomonadales bacterium]
MYGVFSTQCGRAIAFLAAILALATTSPASAANFCVGTRAQAQAALDAAFDNGTVDVIRFRSGVIDVTTTLDFGSTAPSDQLGVTLIGGYNADCSVRTGETALDGNAIAQILQLEIRDGQSVVLDRLTFMRGRNTSYGANVAAVLYDTNAVPSLRIDNCVFLSGESEGENTSAGGLYVSGAGVLRIRNNLFIGNMAQGFPAMSVNLNGEGYITGNTVTGNVITDEDGDAVYVRGASAESEIWISNNIFWGNDADRDLYLFGDDVIGLTRNDIGSRNNVDLLPGSILNVSVDPQFASCGFLCIDKPLKRSSPLVDAGIDTPAGGMPLIDLYGADRTVGPAVDIGAYELDVLFDDGFQ